MKKSFDRVLLGVPLAKPRVALSASSPRADYRAVGFPLQSLTRNSVLLMFMAVINSHSLPAQFTYVGNCDYPDSMELEKPYSFILSNDSLLQELEMTRISNEYIQYSIQISNLKDSSEASSQKFHGIAKWDGCYGALTADNFFYVQNWDYRSKDGSIIISIYGDDPDYVILESNALSKTEMTRK